MNEKIATFTPYEVDTIKNLVWHILFACLTVNGIEDRTQEETGNKPTAMFSYSGHCGAINVQIYRDGWSSDDSKCRVTYDNTVWLDADYGFETVVDLLEQMHRDCCRYLPEEIEAETALYNEIEAKRAELNELTEKYCRRFPTHDNNS